MTRVSSDVPVNTGTEDRIQADKLDAKKREALKKQQLFQKQLQTDGLTPSGPLGADTQAQQTGVGVRRDQLVAEAELGQPQAKTPELAAEAIEHFSALGA